MPTSFVAFSITQHVEQTIRQNLSKHLFNILLRHFIISLQNCYNISQDVFLISNRCLNIAVEKNDARQK